MEAALPMRMFLISFNGFDTMVLSKRATVAKSRARAKPQSGGMPDSYSELLKWRAFLIQAAAEPEITSVFRVGMVEMLEMAGILACF
jgi:hypothetical protein